MNLDKLEQLDIRHILNIEHDTNAIDAFVQIPIVFELYETLVTSEKDCRFNFKIGKSKHNSSI